MDLNSDSISEESNQETFLKELIERGLGIYGKEKMAEICFNSKIGLLDDYSLDWLSDDHDTAFKNLIENYSSINLTAKMTVMVLAKKHGIPLPESVTITKKKSKFLKFLRK